MTSDSHPAPSPHAIEHLFRLDGAVALVTGAGAGFGREISYLLAAAGARVAVADIDITSASDTVGRIRAMDLEAYAFEVDIAVEERVTGLFAAIEAEIGAVQCVVNNAGVQPSQQLLNMTLIEWEEVHRVNSSGTFLCTREAARRMVGQKTRGRILNVSSIGSVHPAVMGNAHYASSKASINMLTKAAALELAEHGITVNALLPGGMLSATRQARMGDRQTWEGPAADPSRFLLGAQPPSVHAPAALFLLSPAASHITGQTLVVDGGFLIS